MQLPPPAWRGTCAAPWARWETTTQTRRKAKERVLFFFRRSSNLKTEHRSNQDRTRRHRYQDRTTPVLSLVPSVFFFFPFRFLLRNQGAAADLTGRARARAPARPARRAPRAPPDDGASGRRGAGAARRAAGRGGGGAAGGAAGLRGGAAFGGGSARGEPNAGNAGNAGKTQGAKKPRNH